MIRHLNNRRATLVSAPSKFYLLDIANNVTAALSFRLLNRNYAGNCMAIRRESDNAILEVGFLNDFIDKASVVAFLGTGKGFVKTWYDQSGNNNNAVTITNSAQPLMYNNGFIINNGVYSIYSHLSAHQMFLNSSTNNLSTVINVVKIENVNTFTLPFTSFSPNVYHSVLQNGSPAVPSQNFGTVNYYKNEALLTATRTVLFNELAVNTKLLTASVPLSSSFNKYQLSYSPSFYGKINISETIITNLGPTNLDLLSNNIKTFYSI